MTPEAFTIRAETYQVAPWSLRMAAKMIDGLFCIAIMGAADALLLASYAGAEVLTGVLMVAALAVALWWWLTSDALLHGSGLGKKLFGLRLLHATHGVPPTLGQAALRQLHYTMLLHPWGLMVLIFDDSDGHRQMDGFVTVRPAPVPDPASFPEPSSPEKPAPRPLDVEALGKFLLKQYSHKDPPSSSKDS